MKETESALLEVATKIRSTLDVDKIIEATKVRFVCGDKRPLVSGCDVV